jgi:hypothetical protein
MTKNMASGSCRKGLSCLVLSHMELSDTRLSHSVFLAWITFLLGNVSSRESLWRSLILSTAYKLNIKVSFNVYLEN